MTIKEAENQYYREVENCRKQHITRAKKAILIWNIIGAVFIVVGVILTIVGYTTPPEITSLGYESLPFSAMLERSYGIGAICLGAFIMISMSLKLLIAIKKGPKDFLPQIRNLYLNYLKCDDVGEDEMEFFKQKLEDIRNIELVNAIHKASTTASAAIMFSSLRK